MSDPVPDPVVVDARGLRCPAPVLRAAATARRHPAGTVLTVLATDPATALDLPAWARMRGHEVLGVDRAADGADAGTLAVRVRLGHVPVRSARSR